MKRSIVAGATRSTLVVVAGLIILAGCSNPFQAGLGNNVDIDRPDGDISSPDAGQYLSGTVTLSGSHSDDMSAIPTVTLEIDGSSGPLAASVDESGWSYRLDTRSYADGEHEIVITITDASGKSTTKRQLYYFDNSAPLVLMTIPQSDPDNRYNGDVTVRGEAADQFGLTRVEYRILDNADQPKTDWATVDGTNSWAFIFDSRDPSILSTTTGTLKVAVRATDRAGNVSNTMLHYDDVLDSSGGDAVTVEALRQILAGESVPGAPVSKPQLEAALLSEPGAVPIEIDQALDNPTFVISNPDENSTIDENVLPGSPKITGTVEDDSEGVDVSSIEYRVTTSGGSTEVDWTSVDATSGTGLLVRWNATISGLSDGEYELEVRADDTGTASGISNAVPFRVDSGAPSVDVTTPAQGAYISGPFTIEGTAYDLTAVTNIRVSLDGGGSWYEHDTPEMGGSLDGSAPDYTWSVTIDPVALGLDDGPRTIKVEASDGTSAATFNLQVVLDNQGPSASFINPSPSSSVNGEVIIRGTASDNNQVEKVELKIGAFDDYIELPGTYNWEYTIDSASYASDTHATETSPGSDVWELEVLARVTDVAGNEHIETGYFFYIDNDLDKPTVTFVSPSAGQRIAGPVLVSGTSFDDDAVQTVRMQLDLNNDGDYDDLVDTDEDGNTDETYEDETVVYTMSGTTLWSYELNNSGELYGASNGDGTVTIGVWAEDIYGTVGNTIERTVQFDDTIPRAENLNYSSSDYVGGDFNLTADILDDVQVKSVKISYNGGQDYVDLVTANTVEPAHSGDIVRNSQNDFSLDINIDTTTALPGLAAPIDSGILYLRLRIEDEANYQSISYINLNVDNLYPTGSWSTAAADPQEIEGTAARVQGTATDSGAVSGIEAIEVYFMRSGQVLRLSDGAPSTPSSADFSDAGGAVTSFDYAPTTAHRVRIDDDNEFGSDGSGNGDGDGYDESITIAGNTYTWWAEFDSTPIDDGPIDIHYVVFDSAGNGTHYLEPGFIKNNRPVLNTVELGTDLNADGDTSDSGERTVPAISAGSLPATGFTAVNDLLFVDLNATGGNGTITYSIEESTQPDVELITSGSTAVIDTSVYGDGTRTFTATLTDSVGIEATATMEIDIANTDTVPPSITFNTLDQTNVKGFGGTLEGHLEANGESLHDGTDADVSGTMILDGTAADDQRLASITVQIDSFDAGSGVGAVHEVASWNGATDAFESTDANFTIVSQSLTEAGGHDVSWQYEWDSSEVTNVASNGIGITFDAIDFGSNSAPDSAQTVDVVPYITAVTRNSAVYNTNRSKFGAYPIQAGETGVVITGFNLDDSGAVVIHTDATGGSLTNAATSDELTVTAVDPAYTSLTVSLAGVTHSGWLRLSVNGIEATNLVNDNSLSQNQESGGSPGSALWTDDRYVSVWEVGDTFANSDNSEYPSMSMASDGTLYGAWTDYATSEAYYGTTGGRTSIFYMYDPAEYTDIHIDDADNISVAYLGNYYGGSGWDDQIGTAGSLNVWNANAPQQVRRAWGYPWNDFYRFEMLYHDETLLQFQRPKVVRDGNDIHVVYFDNDTKSAKYGYTQNGDGSTAEKAWVNLDGGSDADDTNFGAGLVTAGATRSTSAGEYLAIDVDEAGNPVVMYYDTTSATLKLARATNSTPTTPAEWVRQSVFRPDDPNRFFVGKHIAMKIDTAGNIHAVAAKTSVGDLVYLYAPNVDATATDYEFDYSTVVDTEGAVGTWADITLDESVSPAVPYVSYVNTSMVGTFDGAKLAYYDTVEAAWEHLIVPSATTVSDDRTGIAYQPDAGAINGADRRVAIGFKSSQFDIAYWLPEE